MPKSPSSNGNSSLHKKWGGEQGPCFNTHWVHVLLNNEYADAHTHTEQCKTGK